MIIKQDNKIFIKNPMTDNDIKTISKIIASYILKPGKLESFHNIGLSGDDVLQEFWLFWFKYPYNAKQHIRTDEKFSFGIILRAYNQCVNRLYANANLQKNKYTTPTNIVSMNDILCEEKRDLKEGGEYDQYYSEIIEKTSVEPHDRKISTKNFNAILSKLRGKSAIYFKYLFAFYMPDEINYYGLEKFQDIDTNIYEEVDKEYQFNTVLANKLGWSRTEVMTAKKNIIKAIESLGLKDVL